MHRNRIHICRRKSINNAVIQLNGRYPEKGFALNTVCEEVIYVVEGAGKLITPANKVILANGDMARILPNEKYYFNGDLTLVIASSPAWYPEQYQANL